MEILKSLFYRQFACHPTDIVSIVGSGSQRKYYRLSCGNISAIGVIGTDVKENQAFIYISKHLLSSSLSVPEVLQVSDDCLSYLQEDLGDISLYSMLQESKSNPDALEKCNRLIKDTVRLLPKIQYRNIQDFDFNICYPQPQLDKQNIYFDLSYFKYCFLMPSGIAFDEIRLQQDFDSLALDILSEENDCFMYRDFQSRNVMIHNDKPYFIDFQGGRKGQPYYDIASFVNQTRAGFSEDFKQELLEIYFENLQEFKPISKPIFLKRYYLFVLFRLLQVLGAYGFRGLIQGKPSFIETIPQTLSQVRELINNHDYSAYSYLVNILGSLADLYSSHKSDEKSNLTVEVYSFSFKKGYPSNDTGNGGGYAFDCRWIHNPGRYDQYKMLTGRDLPVISFLKKDGQADEFLYKIYKIVDSHIKNYIERGFSDLQISFGCTGGQHRSVYCAENLARYVKQNYNVSVVLIHRELNIREEL